MKQSPEEIIKLFHNKLSSGRLRKINHSQSEEIEELYFQILENLITDYPTYRKTLSTFLGSLEDNDAVAYSASIFFRLYEALITSKLIDKLDLSIFNEKATDKTLDKFFNQFEECLKSNETYRMSEFNFNPDNLSNQEVKEIVSFLVDYIQGDSKSIEWSEEQAQRNLLQLAILKSLLDSLNQSEYFYFVLSMFLDRLNSSEYFQAARDIAEESVFSSFKDGMPDLGFLNSYNCYSRQGSVHAAILYANLSLYCAHRYKKPILDKYFKGMIWESIKCFRDTGLYPLAIEIYKDIPKNIKFNDYERRAIDCTYFLCLIKTKKDNKVPNQILNYLHKEREAIFRAGIHEAIPWLLMLHNVKRIYPDSDFSETGLGFYINVLETIVPKESVNKQIDIIYGKSNKNKDYLKLSILKLNDTRSKNDIVYDNERALTIANRMIEDSFDEQDEEAVLLAMMLKSDFSLIFQPKHTSIVTPFKLPSSDLENFHSLYAEHEKLKQDLRLSKQEMIVWLAVTEGKVFQLSLINEKFVFSHLTSFKWDNFHKLKISNYFSGLSFDETKKDHFGVRNVFPEEHLLNAEKIKNKIDFSRLSATKKSCSVLVVKDMELAKFPHNLILDECGDFIHQTKPIANILSTEWYLSNKDDKEINNDFTKSIWIPTESGDFTLNMLFSSLEAELNKQKFNIFNDIEIISPISSELNIVCSHGDKDIATNEMLHYGDNHLSNIEKVLGKGKILIFFVCHSGSYKDEYFRNDISSIVKTYISLGYKAVIAPFWSLQVNIPAIWLKSFISSMNEGGSINNAVFMANQAVFHEYKTPVAWACMHLYGNPYLSINENN
ncbi:MAG: hypothetical protein KKH22_05420 [Proteobacteria bacterium]|nr:hypothetical protein [Pseudomonadota bacterium]